MKKIEVILNPTDQKDLYTLIKEIITATPNQQEELNTQKRLNINEMIAQRTINAINNLPLDQVLGQYIELQPLGANFIAYSPFVEHRKRKLSLNPKMNIWSCWISGNSGWGSISFLRKALGYTFSEAVHEIAQRFNIAVEYEHNEQKWY